MEAKVKLATKKVSTICSNLKIGLDKRNSRLVKKYVDQLRETLEGLDEICVSAEIEGIDKTVSYFSKADEVNESANALLIDADEYLLDVEESEEVSAVSRVNSAKLEELCKQLCCFKETLSMSAESLTSEADNQSDAVGKVILDKRQQLKVFENQKVTLSSQVDDGQERLVKLECLYRSVAEELAAWVDAALHLTCKPQVSDMKPIKENVGLKLDRLTLPVFSGNVRHFARFLRGFESTVCAQFNDKKVRLMYLQSQCLAGKAKEAVSNLIDYDEAIIRLKQRFGNESIIIDTVLRDIRDIKLSTEEPNAVITLSRKLETAWDDVTAIDGLSEFCNVITLRTIENKLPQRLQVLWAEKKGESDYKGSQDAMENLKVFLEKQRRIAEDVLSMRRKGEPEKEKPNYKPRFEDRNLGHVSAVNISEPKKGACFRCGFTGHQVKECKVPATIKCRKCQKQGHIENACRKRPTASELKDPNPPEQANARGAGDAVCNANVNVKAVRLPVESIQTELGPCLTLWDSGSMLNLVCENWVSRSQIVGKTCNLDFKVVDGSSKSLKTKVYDISLRSKSGQLKSIKAYGIDSLAANVSKLDEETLNNVIQSLNLQMKIDEINNPDGSIQLLLGSQMITEFPEILAKDDNMCVMCSKYGTHKYFIVGEHQKVSSRFNVNLLSEAQDVTVTPTHDICYNVVSQMEAFKDFLSIEDLGIRPPPICKTCKSCEVCRPASQFLSLKEHRELNVIKSKLSFNHSTKKWTASYPFAKDPSVLENNYESALRALKRRERKLQKDDTTCQLYNEQIKDFIERGVIRKMSENEINEWKGPVRYVDHKEVIKEGSTTPVRIVINSSFRGGNELSLNDILMKGPNVLTSLLEVLMKWRLFPVAFLGDISKMYHNVQTGQMEAHVRRLLWRECDHGRPPDIYCFERVTFGDRPAGCIVVSALRATAEMFSHLSAKASNVLIHDSYMDDTLSGDNTAEEAKELAMDIQTIAMEGGFKYKKFVFSGEYEANGETKPAEKALGVIWNPSQDTIGVRIDLNHNKRKGGKRSESEGLEAIPYTRRICLRIVNGIFDPLGITAPVTVKLKILMKNHFTGTEKYKKWDHPLEPKEAMEWIKLLQEVISLKDIAIPRQPLNAPFPQPNEAGKHTLICFTDASQEAMCAAVYLRHETESGEVDVGLIAAKTKVAPVKTTTMPKLELGAALLGSRLINKVTSAMSPTNEQLFDAKYFLLDSTIALGLICKETVQNDFAGNCSAEIRGKTKDCKFGWVSTKHNAADLGSRGGSPESIAAESEWIKGPKWMRESIADWKVEWHEIKENQEVVYNTQLNEDEVIPLEKYSDLHKLHKVTALCLKFIKPVKKVDKNTSKGNSFKDIKITPEEYKSAENYWLKQVCYSTLKMFEEGKLESLRPIKVWDSENNYLKVVTSGRLGKMLKIGYDTEELTILNPEHPYTKLILKDCHEKDHGGDDRAVWRSRERFWIPQARKHVKKIRSKCYRCRLLNKEMAEQLMSPLPNQRVLPTPPWTYTSVDLFGPLEHTDMVRKRLKEKCWGVIFTCMVTRAVHLDLTQAYHTDALLQALRRFMAIRGSPKEMLSDQGSQLVACSKEVSNILELLDWNVVEGWCSKRSIKWKFVPPQGQHMNGVTESLIRSTKHLLKQTIEGKRLTFVEIQTVLCEVSQILNSRPLGLYSKPGTDPLDGGPITPNHLLLGRATNNIPDFNYSNVSNTKRIRFLKTVVDEFWTKWKVVTFQSLVPQYKWHKSRRNVQVGDVVLVHDDSALAGDYKLGQVTEVKVSSDGLVRSCKVRCVTRTENNITKSILERPIHKLCIIVPKEEQ